MTSTASSSMCSRTSAVGHRAPVMCSFRASPLPTPREKPPPSRHAEVAAAWATTAGCMRTVGQVTAVVTGRSQTCEIAPITDHTNGLCPCSEFHGW
jgi:hypothetical protein